MRGDSGGALRWAGAATLMAGLAVGATVLGATLSRVVHEDGGEAVAVRLPADVVATTAGAAVPTSKAAFSEVPGPAPTTTVAAPLTVVFVTGPTTITAGHTATYCMTGSPSPVLGVSVTLDSVPVGPVDDDGCVTVAIDAGPHDLRVVAFGSDGASASTDVRVTGTG